MISCPIFVNTISFYNDIWEMFFGQLNKYSITKKIYVFVEQSIDVSAPETYQVITYDVSKSFRDQLLLGLTSIDDEIILFMKENHILYDQPDVNMLQAYIDQLTADPNISFIKLSKKYHSTNESYHNSSLYYIPTGALDTFTLTPTLWKRSDLIEIIMNCEQQSHINGMRGPQLADRADGFCRSSGVKGLFSYRAGQPIFPCVVSALTQPEKVWNILEYPKVLTKLINEYGIDMTTRGNNNKTAGLKGNFSL